MQVSDKFRVDIQGLRGIAVLLVVLYHLGLTTVSGGYIGVDIFFVISGYLITSHLLASIKSNRFSFSDFYAKRIRRIIPASLFVLFCTLVLSCIFLPPLILPQVLKEAIATALYIPNMYHAFQQTDYLAETSISPFLHYWSLGVEEQFYLLWPIIILLCWKVFHLKKYILTVTLLIIFLASFCGNIFLTTHSQPWAFFLIFTRAWELIAGGLLALAVTRKTLTATPQPKTLELICGWGGLGLLGYCATTYNEHTTFPGAAALLPVLAAALIIFAGTTSYPTTTLNRLLANRPLQYIGTISYSFYLWHWPVIVFAKELFPNLSDIYSPILLFTVSLILADITYRFIEQPFRYRAANIPTRSVLIYSLFASIFITIAAGGYGYQLKSNQLHADKNGSEYAATTNPTFSSFVPENLVPNLRQTAKSIPVIYGNDCHDDFFTINAPGCIYGKKDGNKTYVLFGDSHAAQWFPALEKYTKEHNIRLIPFTKSACPSLDLRIFKKGTEYVNCSQWYKTAVEKINVINPEVIIISNYQGNQKDVIAVNKIQEWKDGLARSIQHFPATSKVIVLGDTPSFKRTPALCLSKNIFSANKCTFPRENLLNKELADAEKDVALSNKKMFVDMNNYLCSAEECGAIIGNVLVYRDQHHLTVEFSERLANILGEAIETGDK